MRIIALGMMGLLAAVAAFAAAPPVGSSEPFPTTIPLVTDADRLASCAGLSIEGPDKVRQHRMVILKPSGGAEGSAYDWEVSPDDRAHVEQRGDELLFTAPPGTYRVTLRAISVADGKVGVKKCRLDVTIEGDAPPTPIPVPPPPDKGKPPPDGKANPARALLKLRVGSSGCTATVIGPRRADGRWDVLTASHCLDRAGKGTVTTQDGRTLRVTKTAQDARADICWLVTDDPVEDLPFATLCKEVPPAGTPLWHAGYGVDRPGNREEGTVLGVDGQQLRMMLNVSSGDSGGGIFRADTGELIANVCCTRSRASRTTMWGGHSVRAIEMRPKGDRLNAPFLYDE